MHTHNYMHTHRDTLPFPFLHIWPLTLLAHLSICVPEGLHSLKLHLDCNQNNQSFWFWWNLHPLLQSPTFVPFKWQFRNVYHKTFIRLKSWAKFKSAPKKCMYDVANATIETGNWRLLKQYYMNQQLTSAIALLRNSRSLIHILNCVYWMTIMEVFILHQLQRAQITSEAKIRTT